MGFADRVAAGRALGEALRRFSDDAPLILALPRGGVPVGYEVAKTLGAPLDVLLVRKIGVPGQEELALGAVVEGKEPQLVVNESIARMVHVDVDYLARQRERQLGEIARRRELYRRGRAPLDVSDRAVIVVDDGIATGATVRAALRGLRRAGAGRRVLAVPVAPADTVADLEAECDELVCLETPEPFIAVGLHYDRFDQTTDEEVVALLDRAAGESSIGK